MEADGSARLLRRAVLGAIALSAPLFALLTFQREFIMTASMLWSLPVLGIEVFIIIAAWLEGFRYFKTIRNLPGTVTVALAIWLVAAVSASFFAVNPIASSIWLGASLIHLTFAIALYDRFSGPWHAWRNPALFSLAASLLCYVAVVNIVAFTVWDDPGFNWANIGAGAINVRHLGFYAIALVGLGLGNVVAAPNDRRWIAALALATAGYYFSTWSGGRSPFIVAFFATIIAAAISPLGRRLKTVLAGGLLWATASAVTLITAPPSPLYGLSAIISESDLSADRGSASLLSRLGLWNDAAQAIAQQPFLGHGQGSFGVLVSEQRGVLHPHNLALQLLYDWGVLGAAAIAWLVWAGIRRVPSWVRADRQAVLPALGPPFCLLVTSLADGPFVFGYPQFVMALCVAVLASTHRADGGKILT